LCGNFSAKGLFASHFLGRSDAAKRDFKKFPDEFPVSGNLSLWSAPFV